MYINKNSHHSIFINTILSIGFIFNTDEMLINYKTKLLVKLLFFYLLINFVLKTKRLTNRISTNISHDCNEITTMMMRNSIYNNNVDENVCFFKQFLLIYILFFR